MARCYLDIAIGDRLKHAQDLEAHERAKGYFAAVASQVRGLGARRPACQSTTGSTKACQAADRAMAATCLPLPPPLLRCCHGRHTA